MPLSTWPSAFFVTVLVEVPIIVALTRGIPWPIWRRAALALIAQLATHPIVWFFFPGIVGLTRRESLWLSELWAWLAEAAVYLVAFPRTSPLQATAISGIANAMSLATGLAVRALR